VAVDPVTGPVPEGERWWHRATAYQVYPRSFADSDGDGVGDIPGIISRLDHLADLGIGFVWLSPVYASPMADNGYDIADYRAVAPEFGTLEDLDRLVAEARARGIRIVMDLVVNHSSSAHPWFEAARASREAPEHDFYVWRPSGPDGGPPDARRAAFGGPAWSWVEEVGAWYLHLFSPEQPDLNWRNPKLRAEIHDMMNWWFDRGIAGFRMDVIDLIGKDPDRGVYEDGPFLHEYLRELHRETLAGRDVVTIGETWSATLENALLYCGRGRDELDMVFQFSHVIEGLDPEHGKWRPRPFDLPGFKRVMNAWQALMEEDGWNSLFLSNHDLPRQVSRYGDDGRWRVRSAKAIATVIHLMKGTPFVYQGEEIGMTNIHFDRLDQFRDLEVLRHYPERIAEGMSPDDFIAAANAVGRDNARTPMQWTDGPGAGFTTGDPWIGINPNHVEVNVEADRADPDGVFEHYRRLIALRRAHDAVAFGRYTPFDADHPQVVAFLREGGGERIAVVANWSGEPVTYRVPDGLALRGECLVHGAAPRDAIEGEMHLEPWESLAVLARGAG
jgi:oligo-1,6-glucosidase